MGKNYKPFNCKNWLFWKAQGMYIYDVYNTRNKPWLPYTREKLITNKNPRQYNWLRGEGMQYATCRVLRLWRALDKRTTQELRFSWALQLPLSSRNQLPFRHRSASKCPVSVLFSGDTSYQCKPGTTFHTSLFIEFCWLSGFTCASSLNGVGFSFVYFETVGYSIHVVFNNK